MNTKLVGEVKLKALVTKLIQLDSRLKDSLNLTQQEYIDNLYKLKKSNQKNKGNWQHRTSINESQEALYNSWNKLQLRYIKNIMGLISAIQNIESRYMNRQPTSSSIIEKYKLYYIT